jgi:hypothetical protein
MKPRKKKKEVEKSTGRDGVLSNSKQDKHLKRKRGNKKEKKKKNSSSGTMKFQSL